MNRRVMLPEIVIVVLTVLFLLPGNGISQELNNFQQKKAYDMLNTVPDTYLIDVRTRAEYQFVGHPVGAYLYPFMFYTNELMENDNAYTYRFNVKNHSFIEEISKVFLKTNNLLIISRDGTRSALAAMALSRAGFKNIYDVTDGFEGAEFPYFEAENNQKFYRQLARRNKVHGFNHRRHYGWQWWGLPWNYEMDPKCIYPPDLAPEGK